MAGVVKVNGNYESIEMIHRNLWFKAVGNGGPAMSQVQFNELMQEIALTCTIEVIGTFVAGTSTAVNIIISGADVNTADVGITGDHTVADIAGW